VYLHHFNLAERPFSITPDPRFLYMSARHREALAHLMYGLGEGGGFVQLTGEVGTGKTTISRCLLEQVPDNVDIALVLNPKVTAEELIATLCDELGVDYPAEIHSIKTLTDLLNRYLLDAHARGRRTVLIIDEAQNLSAEVLEQVRLLTNLETATQKLLQIILIGQPELRTLLAREEMRQLAQRVTARYHLEPISREETGAYIQHRLQVCGISHSIFKKDAIDAIHQLAGGIPRLINVLCDRTMLGAYAEGESRIDGRIVKKAAKEVLADSATDSGGWRRIPLAAAGLVLVAGIAGLVYFQPWGRVGITPAMSGKPALPPLAVEPSVEHRIEESGGTQIPVAIGMSAIPASPPILPAQPAAETLIAMAEPALPATTTVQPEPSLDSLLGMADSSWDRAAWKALFAQWSVVLPPAFSGDFCEFAVENDLHCLDNNGTWESLRLFDRPAILKLEAVAGRQIPLLLQHLDDGMAEVNVAGSRYRVPVEEVDAYWGGEFVLLLKTPPGGTMYMEMGGRGTDVGWLRGQLEAIQGVELASEDPLYFDYRLYKQVLTFQRDYGLATDGIVGRHTIILLNTHSRQPGIPSLLGVTS
jgi:general secretion pathway protein A